MKLKTNIIKLILISAFAVSVAQALPPCRDCAAEFQACKTSVEAVKVQCTLNSQTTYDLLVRQIDLIKADALAQCDEDHDIGSIPHNFCYGGVYGLTAPAYSGAWSAKLIRDSACRSSYHQGISGCDMDSYNCSLAVATARANCECE